MPVLLNFGVEPNSKLFMMYAIRKLNNADSSRQIHALNYFNKHVKLEGGGGGKEGGSGASV